MQEYQWSLRLVRYIQDPKTLELIPADQYQREVRSTGPHIMPDLKDYKSVAWDKERGGQVVVSGRKQHREFLRRNGYEEVGNG